MAVQWVVTVHSKMLDILERQCVKRQSRMQRSRLWNVTKRSNNLKTCAVSLCADPELLFTDAMFLIAACLI